MEPTITSSPEPPVSSALGVTVAGPPMAENGAMSGMSVGWPLRLPSSLSDYFDLRTITPDAEARVADLTVRCRFTMHPIPTVGLLVSQDGATLAWSGDTPFEQAHVDWLSEADLIVHESNVSSAHTPIERLNALPPDIRAKMRLIHLLDDFPPQCTDMAPLREGEVLDI